MRFPGFIGPSYTSQSVNVDCQRCVNYYPEINPLGTGKEREVASLVPTPGLRLLLTLAGSPIRGIWSASNGQLFAVGGQTLYRISSAWVATEIGTLNSLSGPVSMANNETQLVIVDGDDGYVWSISSSTFNEITDEDFPGADQVTFQDGYFLFVKPDSQQFFLSAINDGTDYDALDIASAEGSPDRLVGLISANQNVLLFGTKSLEVFYNSGDADFPFARIQGAVVDVGCSARFSIAKAVGSVFWIGGDITGTGIVYQSVGYQPKRISTQSIEKVIKGLTPDELAASTGYTYQQGGHLFYCVNLKGAKSTWVYDVTTELWHEREYKGDWYQERHRGEFHALAYGENVVCDYENGKIYAFDQDKYTDDGTLIVRERAAPHLSKSGDRIGHNSFQLDMETGVGLDGTGQGADPKVMLQWSDDGGHTWSGERWADAGKIGKYKTRVIWRRLGMSRDRVYRVRITDPVKTVLIGANLDLEEEST